MFDNTYSLLPKSAVYKDIMYSLYGCHLIKYLPLEVLENIYTKICDIIMIDFNNDYISFINPYNNFILRRIINNYNNILIHEHFIYSFYYQLTYFNLIDINISNINSPDDNKLNLINKIYDISNSLKEALDTIIYAFSQDFKYYVNVKGYIQNCFIEIIETNTKKRITSRYFNVDYIFIFEDFGSNIVWENNRIAFSVYRIMSPSSKVYIFDTNLNLIEDYKLSHRAIMLNWSNNNDDMFLVSIDEHENKGSIIRGNFIKYLYFDNMNIISFNIAPNDKQIIINDNHNYKIYDLF